MAAPLEKNNEENSDKKPRTLLRIIKAAVFVSVLVGVEVVAASFLIPSPQDTVELAKKLATVGEGEEITESQETAITDAQTKTDEKAMEVEIGSFSVTRFNPDSSTTINIDFELFGTVLVEEQADFIEQFEASQNRVREQVVLTLHGAKITDLTDAGLGLIKRRILENTNRALGKPLVREVLLTRFNFVER